MERGEHGLLVLFKEHEESLHSLPRMGAASFPIMHPSENISASSSVQSSTWGADTLSSGYSQQHHVVTWALGRSDGDWGLGTAAVV